MSIEALVARYGLLAIAAGAGLEGEAVVASGGVLAHKGLLPFWGVAAAAALGSFVVDQFWFLAGRRLRDRRWVKRIRERPAFARALALLERHSTLFILGFRFVYGMRTVSPIAIGTSAIPARRFVVLNAAAAAVWAPLIAWVGYGLGRAIARWAPELPHPLWPWVATAVALLLFGGGFVWWWLRRRRSSATLSRAGTADAAAGAEA